MSILTPGFRLEKIIATVTGYALPERYIETGTYRGNSALLAAKNFKKVETIELSDRWYEYSKDRLKDFSNVICHLGDCVKVLPILLEDSQSPVYFFLDAHFSGGTTALGDKEVPLMEELQLILERKSKDIIVIDDLRLIGNKGQTGIKGHEVYPEMEFDWSDVSLEDIEVILQRYSYTTFQYIDRIYAYKNLNAFQLKLMQLLFFVSNLIKGNIEE